MLDQFLPSSDYDLAIIPALIGAIGAIGAAGLGAAALAALAAKAQSPWSVSHQ